MPLPKATIANNSVLLYSGQSHELPGRSFRPWFVTRGADNPIHRIGFVANGLLLHVLGDMVHQKNFSYQQPTPAPTPKTHPQMFLREGEQRNLFADPRIVLSLSRETAGEINAVIEHKKPSFAANIVQALWQRRIAQVESSPVCVTRGGVVFKKDRNEAHEIRRMSFDMTVPFMKGQQAGYCDLIIPEGAEISLKIPAGGVQGLPLRSITLATIKRNDKGEIVATLREMSGRSTREVKVTPAPHGIHLPELGMKVTLFLTREGEELLRLEYFKPTVPLVVEV